MQITYGKIPSYEERKEISNLALSCGILYDTARLLYCRGITTEKQVLRFLSPSESHFYNPFLLNGMKSAVERITSAKLCGERVVVFGDYDADGVCATKVLVSALKKFGINAGKIIPERENGYGLNFELVLKEHEKNPIDLIITVDCGISDGEKIEKLKKYGIDVIVTDHHEPPEVLPNVICINPKIPGQEYPFNGLCGAGVAYKLGYALIGNSANKYLDFVAIATVADSMDMLDENRDIVHVGLKLLNKELRPCLKYLINKGQKKLTARDIAFSLAPKINAGGRMGDISSVAELFFSEDEKEIYSLSVKLSDYNMRRQTECSLMFNQANSKISENELYKNNVIVVADERWRTGLIAILAAKLSEEYCRPVIAFSEVDGKFRGSARSVVGINIFEAIGANSNLLTAFGGHSQAAGLTLEKENLDKFSLGINSYVKENYGGFRPKQEIFAEWHIEGQINSEFFSELEKLEPFGPCFQRPVFTVSAVDLRANLLKEGSDHVSMKACGMEMIMFHGKEELCLLKMPANKLLLIEPNVSVFNKREYVKGMVKKVFLSREPTDAILPFILERELKNLSVIEDELTNPQILDSSFILNDLNATYVLTDITKKNKFPILKDFHYDFSGKCTLKPNCLFGLLPTEIPDWINKIIYLEKPLYIPKTKAEVLVLNNKNQFLKYLSLDRTDFIWVFNILKEKNNREWTSSADFFKEGYSLFQALQGVFATEVFMELGFFKHKNGALYLDSKVKADLKTSKIYKRIEELKVEP